MAEIRENCGIFGIRGSKDAVEKTYYGLFALQHRGQESTGIATTCGNKIYSHLGMGLVNDVFTPEILLKLRNSAAIGHIRYSTTGSSSLLNAQPMVVNYHRGRIALCHNGNLTNARELRREYEKRGKTDGWAACDGAANLADYEADALEGHDAP